MVLRTHGADDTRALAATIAEALRPGDVVSLSGELGAGKTCFVQGAASALGVTGRVTSPTFTLVRPYQARLPGDDVAVELVHVDVYRLDRLQEVVELGEDVILGDEQITFVEWGDVVDALLGTDRLEVELALGDADDERIVRVRGHGRWADRVADVAPRLQRWAVQEPSR
ncbi:MAG: tRNA (adenosine(37)-N6)-threonylcarbamoyltransferase complex ATPase subunit type 1 TsaE [Actinobacteria bacterium]|nr:tRNA (adenosine(37)-N6)-threonylcarbamoyltransferase complex ATPase subunit type 1 TsaE [Actinomycetota bacterium]